MTTGEICNGLCHVLLDYFAAALRIDHRLKAGLPFPLAILVASPFQRNAAVVIVGYFAAGTTELRQIELA